jgi:glycosyltransferase involved in cell wall biosynthesis
VTEAGSGEAPAPVVLALVAARNEAERVGATVTALRALPAVAEVLVVSDGSTDATAAGALGAGAHCLELPRNLGKGGALNAGLAALMGRVAERVSPEPVALLLADGDLGSSAARLDRVLAPVLAGSAWPWAWRARGWRGSRAGACPSRCRGSARSAGRRCRRCCRSHQGSGSRWP